MKPYELRSDLDYAEDPDGCSAPLQPLTPLTPKHWPAARRQDQPRQPGPPQTPETLAGIHDERPCTVARGRCSGAPSWPEPSPVFLVGGSDGSCGNYLHVRRVPRRPVSAWKAHVAEGRHPNQLNAWNLEPYPHDQLPTAPPPDRWSGRCATWQGLPARRKTAPIYRQRAHRGSVLRHPTANG